MQRQSEQALQQMESAVEVESSVDKIGPLVAKKLDGMAAPHFAARDDGSQAPRFLDVMIALKEGLGDSRRRLAEADYLHIEQLRRLIELREERGALHDELYGYLSTARKTVEDLFGPGRAFVLASLEGPTARKSSKLLRQAEIAIQRLGRPDLKLPEPRIDGVAVTPETLAKGIRARADRLEAVLADQRQLRRASQETRKLKNRALAEHRPLFVNTSRALESFYRLAGEEEHADRIRPSLRQAGRRLVDVQADEADSEDPAAEEPAAGAPETGDSAPRESAPEASPEALAAHVSGPEPGSPVGNEPEGPDVAS